MVLNLCFAHAVSIPNYPLPNYPLLLHCSAGEKKRIQDPSHYVQSLHRKRILSFLVPGSLIGGTDLFGVLLCVCGGWGWGVVINVNHISKGKLASLQLIEFRCLR